MNADLQPITTPAKDPAAQGPRLTIETKRLKDLWLPSYRANIQAYEELLKLYFGRKKENAVKNALLRGSLALKERTDEQVAHITERGGLLLIGGAA